MTDTLNTPDSPADNTPSASIEGPGAVEAPRPSTPRLSLNTLGFRGLELLGATSMAVTQPLLGLLGDNPVFFVVHGIHSWDLVTYAIMVTFAVPVVLFISLTAVALVFPRLGMLAHEITLGALISATLIPPIARVFSLQEILWWVLLLVTAAGAAILLRRMAPFRSFLRLLSISSLLFIGFFLFISPASTLLDGPVGEDDRYALASSNTSPTVWLVLDTFPLTHIVGPDGAIVEERYPNLARLAKISNWYPHATTNSTSTVNAIPAAMTGTWPDPELEPLVQNHPTNLFTLLGSEDYPIYAAEHVTYMCPTALCGTIDVSPTTWSDTRTVWVRLVLPAQIASAFVPRLNQAWGNFGHGDVPLVAANAYQGAPQQGLGENDLRDAATIFAQLSTSNLRGLHYSHLPLPHFPFRFLPSGQPLTTRVYSDPHDSDGYWRYDESAVSARLQAAIAQAIFADSIVGILLDTLEKNGTIDDALIVVMSDHGETSWSNQHFRSTEGDPTDPAGPLVDTLPIPLFIKAPGQTEGLIDDRPVQLVDLLPTVLDLLEITLPNSPSGNTAESDSTVLATSVLDFDGLSLITDDDATWRKRTPMFLTDNGLAPLSAVPIAEKSNTVALIDRLFMNPSSPFKLWPHGGLLGRGAEGLQHGQQSSTDGVSLTATLDKPDLYEKVDLSGGLPANVAGTLKEVPSGAHIAVVLNGTIAGIGQSHTNEGDHRFTVLVEPEWFIEGSNSIELWGTTDENPDSAQWFPIRVTN